MADGRASHQARSARRIYERKDAHLAHLEKEKARINVAAVREDEAAHSRDERATQQKLSHQEALVSSNTRKVKREQKRAMRLMHMSHKLQAKAAQLIDASTKDIQLEEEGA